MSNSANYIDKIAKYERSALNRLWKLIEDGKTETDGWEAGKALEYLILRAFEIEGATVRWPFQVSNLEQIDGVIYADSLSCLIECKDQAATVNIEPIAKLRNQLLRRPTTTAGIVFSRQGFTDPALTLALYTSSHPILLWTGEEIAFALKNRYLRKGLLAKYRRCVEEGQPDYNLRLEVLK